MSDDVIARIKERVDVVELVSSYLKLTKAGVNYKARCPFHNEKTGSFFVSPERQIWHCFGCGKGGDVFGFVREIEGVEFPEALRTLARKAGVELTPYSPEQKQFQSQKTRLYEICELAAKFFEKQLWHSATGQQALEYLHGRGLVDKSIRDFRLGWAPDNWQALSDYLGSKYASDEIVAAGVAIASNKPSAVSNKQSRSYDRFRSRIIFPIADLNGQVVGFSGRILELAPSVERKAPSGEDTPTTVGAKYINTPQTPIYDKSRLLYGLDKAKLAIRQQDRCLVIEGNMDVVMSHQGGVVNAVASSGTALTDGHLKIIKRYTENLDLCFDMDSAGELATNRGVELALARGFNVGVLTMDEPGLKDPADYVQKHGAQWSEYAVHARPFLEVFFEKARQQYDLTTAVGKKLLTQRILPFLAAVASKVEQAHWVSELAVALKLKEAVLQAELANVKPLAMSPNDPLLTAIPAQPPVNQQRLSLLEETLLSLLVKDPDLVEKVAPEQELFLSDRCRRLIQQIDDSVAGNERELVGQLAVNHDTLPDQPAGLQMSLDIIYLKAQELWKDFESHQLAQECDRLLAQTKRHYVSAQLERLEYDIKAAERNKDKILLASLMADFSKIAKELGN